MEVRLTRPADDDFEQLMIHVVNQLGTCVTDHKLALKHIDNNEVILWCKTCDREYGFSRRIYNEMFTWKEQAQFKKAKYE